MEPEFSAGSKIEMEPEFSDGNEIEMEEPESHLVPVTTSNSTFSSKNGADYMFGLSVAGCIACFCCGSPLTILCFLPAIVLAMLGRQYALDGEPDKTKKATVAALVFIIIGIFTGLAVILYFIIRVFADNESEETSNQQYNN